MPCDANHLMVMLSYKKRKIHRYLDCMSCVDKTRHKIMNKKRTFTFKRNYLKNNIVYLAFFTLHKLIAFYTKSFHLGDIFQRLPMLHTKFCLGW